MPKGVFLMNMSKKEYNAYVQRLAPKSPIWKDLLNAFWTGGLICVLGQLIQNGWTAAGLDKDAAGSATAISLIFLSAVLTALSVYNCIAKFAGAGTLVPITGFANSVAAPAVEYQKEGQVFGIGSKIFTIAGPVILYGVLTSWVLGLIQYVAERW